MKPGRHQLTLWLTFSQLAHADRVAKKRKTPRATAIKQLIEEAGRRLRKKAS